MPLRTLTTSSALRTLLDANKNDGAALLFVCVYDTLSPAATSVVLPHLTLRARDDDVALPSVASFVAVDVDGALADDAPLRELIVGANSTPVFRVYQRGRVVATFSATTRDYVDKGIERALRRRLDGLAL